MNHMPHLDLLDIDQKCLQELDPWSPAMPSKKIQIAWYYGPKTETQKQKFSIY